MDVNNNITSAKNAYEIFKECIESENFTVDLDEYTDDENPIMLIITIKDEKSTNFKNSKELLNSISYLLPNFEVGSIFSKIWITVFYDNIDKIKNIQCSDNNNQGAFFDRVNNVIYFFCRVSKESNSFLYLLDKLYTTPKPAKR
jgi:hypothetical protein